DELAAGDGGAAEASAALALPALRRPARRPVGADVGVSGGAVARRPEELRPVAGAGSEGRDDQGAEQQAGGAHRRDSRGPGRGGAFPGRGHRLYYDLMSPTIEYRTFRNDDPPKLV